MEETKTIKFLGILLLIMIIAFAIVSAKLYDTTNNNFIPMYEDNWASLTKEIMEINKCSSSIFLENDGRISCYARYDCILDDCRMKKEYLGGE